MVTKNAIIKSTMLGGEDHGIMTFWLHLDFGGTGQGYGGYGLDAPLKRDGKFIRRIGTAFGLEAIMRVLAVVGVHKWEDLKGKHIRVNKTKEWGEIISIGHIIEDEWLDLKELASKYDDDTGELKDTPCSPA